MFVVKKICGLLCMSMPVLTVLFLVALFLLLFSKRQVLAKHILFFTVIIFILAGYGAFSKPLITYLESRYAPIDIQSARQAGIKWVVVLGGGYVSEPALPATAQLGFESQARLIEGIRIKRALPESRLLVSGGAFSSQVSQAQIFSTLAQELGVPPAEIVLEGKSLDTKDEARLIKGMIKSEPFILVTSAYHMPRSMALFQGQGLKPIAAPAGRQYHASNSINYSTFFPLASNLQKTDLALHEFLGLLSAKIMGQF